MNLALCTMRLLPIAVAFGMTASVPVRAADDDRAAGIAQANRMTWGVTPSMDLSRDGTGSYRWLSRQLNAPPGDLPPEAEAQIATMRITKIPMMQLVAEMNAQNRAARAMTDPDEAKSALSAYGKSMNALADEARSRFILRALYAPDQLREQMTWFWFNHFNVAASKRDIRAMVGNYEDRLRAGALGKFRDLLETTVRHPAMLRYLDNDQNAAGHINENYAREIMELHTMGVGSGYTQKDVQELARILTGVGVSLKPKPRLKPAWQPLYIRAGLFEFNPARHDFREKRFLGHRIKGSGFAEVEQALDLLARAPSTARHVSTRIATYFMGDSPPAAVVDQMTRTFQRTDGDIGQVLHAMIRAPGFSASLGKAFKDPVHYVISAVRLAYGDRVILNTRPMIRWMTQMGEGLYGRNTPDGYDLKSTAWTGPGQLAMRFDIARQIGAGSAGLFRPAGATADRPAFPQIRSKLYFDALDTMLSKPTRTALSQANSPQEWNALFLSSPEFMHR